jgi:hypothetical protein
LTFFYFSGIITILKRKEEEMKEALCRPDDSHWCIECCPRSCPLLGDTGDGKRGCLGHEKNSDGLSERIICQSFDCLDDFSAEDRETIRKIILKEPPGEFKMSEILKKFKVGRIVCAWCGKEMGRKLGIEGDTHGICDKCFQKQVFDLK